ncbi:zinc ribbon domain-containing protein [Paraclostridium bifermentans]|uniref:zinc ribbon domain-containing protein n=1 Tax=Paraclostridium bifermentans TaxID=1490 RepID=UPI0018AA8909|nr:zinc ribbon domain-containing protein [Paraclostridium bifermentans]
MSSKKFNMNNKNLSLETIKEKNRLNIEIEKAKKEKTKIFGEAGMKLYEMIRKDNIIQEELISLFDNMIELDKIIYECNLKLEKIQSKNTTKCECGNILNDESKFCSQCGKKVKEEIEFETCEFCSSEISENANFCVCCGRKVSKNI